MTSRIVLLSALCAAACAAPPPSPEKPMEKPDGTTLAHRFIVVDTHVDLPYRLEDKWEDISVATADGDFDVPRARAGGLDAPFMSIYVPSEKEDNGAKQLADELIDLVERLIAEHPDTFAAARSPADVRRNFDSGLISLPLGMENGSPIEHDLANLRHFYDRGIRYITLAHAKANHLSDSSFDQARPNGGLSEFGVEVVHEMNRLGIMVDVSHLSDEAFYDVMRESAVPVIASHSSTRHLVPGFERNMDDDMIRALAEAGGVIQLNAGSSFLTSPANAYLQELFAARAAFLAEHGVTADSDEARAFTKQYRNEHAFPFATLDDYLDHFDHVVQLVGVDHVGIGTDFEGVGDSLPVGFKDVSCYPALFDGLLARGYGAEDIEKIAGGNLLRVWEAVEAAAR